MRNVKSLLPLLCLLSCNTTGSITMKGSVVTETTPRTAVANATVVFQGVTVTQTGGDGSFVATADSLPDPVVVHVAASGYATQTLTVSRLVATSGVLKASLRPFDVVQAVQVPTVVGGTPASLTASRNGLSASIKLGFGALFNTTDTMQAAGTISASMAFWPPSVSSETAPASVGTLLADPNNPAINPNTLYALDMYAVVAIDLRQSGQLLGIAQNSLVPLSVDVPPATLAQHLSTAGTPLTPSLFYHDPKLGHWVEKYRASDKLPTDANSYFIAPSSANPNTYVAQMVYLDDGTWGLGVVNPNRVAACVAGTAHAAASTTAAYTGTVAVAALGARNLSVAAVAADTTGHYCLDVAVRNAASLTLNYYVSGADGLQNSSLPNPLSATELATSDVGSAWAVAMSRDSAVIASAGVDGDYGLGLGASAPTGWSTVSYGKCASSAQNANCVVSTASGSVSVQSVTLSAGTSCAAGGCAVLQDFSVVH